MPELPEVETIARALREGGRGGSPILGWRVSAVQLLWERTLAQPGTDEFVSRLVGQTVMDITRRGKFVVIQFERDHLIIHLRMSGDLRVEPGLDSHELPVPVKPHDRLVIYFENHMRLAFNDTRKFGRVWLAGSVNEVTGNLGPEPFDQVFTPDLLYQMLHERRRQVKPLLLDQTFIAGMGNIYTDEALFLAKIHPLRVADTLTRAESDGLWSAIRQVLQEGIQRNGASFDWVYRGGKFEFRVYQRTGEPCLICGSPIQKITVGQRGTHFCRVCQPVLDTYKIVRKI